jgi:hypothetical protein
MKYEKHKGNEHVPRAGGATGNRRRLIPETETERALLASILSEEEMSYDDEEIRKEVTFGGDPANDLLPDTEDQIDGGWYGCTYRVEPAFSLNFLKEGENVRGYACVVEHPHRDEDHHRRIEVWYHFPEQEGCGGVTGTTSESWPVALMQATDKIQEGA